MIQLFNVDKQVIDTSEFSNLLHDSVVKDFEDNSKIKSRLRS